MNRGPILNSELAHAIATMGHGDLMIVCDAGFPIPAHGLAHRPGYRAGCARPGDRADGDQRLLHCGEGRLCRGDGREQPAAAGQGQRIFADSDFDPMPHQQILTEMAAKAKVIVRTGAFDPWGNILLYSGVDVRKWFAKPGVKVPEYYAKRMK